MIFHYFNCLSHYPTCRRISDPLFIHAETSLAFIKDEFISNKLTHLTLKKSIEKTSMSDKARSIKKQKLFWWWKKLHMIERRGDSSTSHCGVSHGSSLYADLSLVSYVLYKDLKKKCICTWITTHLFYSLFHFVVS